MNEERRDPKPSQLHKVYDQIVDSASKTAKFIRENTEAGIEQVQDLFSTTAEHVADKAGVAQRFVRIGMAIAEVEEHLSRLYPEIGKRLADLTERHVAAPLQDEQLRARISLATEYRQRLADLRQELATVSQAKATT